MIHGYTEKMTIKEKMTISKTHNNTQYKLYNNGWIRNGWINYTGIVPFSIKLLLYPLVIHYYKSCCVDIVIDAVCVCVLLSVDTGKINFTFY